MKEFWNERYAAPEFAYGETPNGFLQEQLPLLKPGKMLFPAEGEGRNAVFAAQLGWEAHAFDFSTAAAKKAERLASNRGVSIHYEVADLDAVKYPAETFDAMALVFAHFPAAKRSSYHRTLGTFLKPGGIVLVEAFSKSHIRYNADGKAGGPRDPAMLYSREELAQDFPGFEIILLEETEVELNEGLYHNGLSAVVRFIGKKL